MEAKEKDEWRYWQADLLLERGREAEAKEILHQLMQQRGFYPMVAAQRIGEEYELKIDKAPQNVDSALTQGPEMARVRELMYWNLDNTARSRVGQSGEEQVKNRAGTAGTVCFQQPMVGSQRSGDDRREVVGSSGRTIPAGLQRFFQTLHQR